MELDCISVKIGPEFSNILKLRSNILNLLLISQNCAPQIRILRHYWDISHSHVGVLIFLYQILTNRRFCRQLNRREPPQAQKQIDKC